MISLLLYATMRTHFGPGPRTAVLAGIAGWVAFSLTGPVQFIPLGFFKRALAESGRLSPGNVDHCHTSAPRFTKTRGQKSTRNAILLFTFRNRSRWDASLSSFAEVDSESDESLSRNSNCLSDGNCCLRSSWFHLLGRQINSKFAEDI